jgi:putative addiction module killer protein
LGGPSRWQRVAWPRTPKGKVELFGQLCTADGANAFGAWFDGLRDPWAQERIAVRIDRLALGLFGDAKPLRQGEGVRKLRIDCGPGYRVYYCGALTPKRPRIAAAAWIAGGPAGRFSGIPLAPTEWNALQGAQIRVDTSTRLPHALRSVDGSSR